MIVNHSTKMVMPLLGRWSALLIGEASPRLAQASNLPIGVEANLNSEFLKVGLGLFVFGLRLVHLGLKLLVLGL